MQEDDPLFPRIVQGALQLLQIVHDAEAAAGVRVLEWVGVGSDAARKRRRPTRRKLKERLRRLKRQVIRKLKQAILIGAAYIGQPLGGNAVGQQLVVGNVVKGEWPGLLYLHVDRDLDLLDRLAHFDKLGRARSGMRLQPPALRPAVGAVVVVDVAEQQAILRAVNDDADIRTDAHGPEVGIARPVQPVELQAGPRRIHLQVESRRFDRLLLAAAQPGKTIGEGIGDAEIHEGSGQWLVVGG